MKRIEETDVRSRVRAAELQLLADGKAIPAEGTDDKGAGELTKLRKALAAAEVKSSADEKIARDAMKLAAAKVQVADVAAARAKRLAEEVKDEEHPEPVAEKAGETKPATAKSDKANHPDEQ
jgi:hypothetical protein